MSDLFDTLIGPLIDREGPYSNNPNDPGGETAYGVTIAIARENGYAGPMRAMTRAQAVAIYRTKYWAKAGLYLIAPLSSGIAGELFDCGVNQGTGTAGIFLQRALNALNEGGRDYPDIVVDGGVGPATAGAMKAFLAKRQDQGEPVLLKAIACLRGARYVTLAEQLETNEDFVFGWLANRVPDFKSPDAIGATQ